MKTTKFAIEVVIISFKESAAIKIFIANVSYKEIVMKTVLLTLCVCMC